MTEKLQQTIKEELAELPKESQTAIASIDWLKIAEDIGREFNLEEEEVEDLQLETLLVLIGAVDMEFCAINIENHVGTTTEMAKDLATMVSKKIFQPILEKFPKKTETKIGDKMILPKQPVNSNIVDTAEANFDKLPTDIGDIMRDSNFQTTLYSIAQTHHLSVTEMGLLDKVTTDLITGAIHPNEFKNALLKSLRLQEEETNTLVSEINEKIFKKIREKLMGLGKPAPKALDEVEEKEMEVLKIHGIEIIPEKLEIATTKIGTPVEPAKIHPILAQKMSGPVQASTVKSNYGLNNAPVSTGEAKPVVRPSSPKPTTYSKNADPYRTPID